MSVTKERINNFFRYKDLVFQLVKKDIKLKYRRSFLGYIWSILNPLLIMSIMVIVFRGIFRFEIENYAAYVITGQVCFTFLSESTNQAIWSITGNASLLKKTYVPKYIFSFAKVTSSCVNLIFSLGALLVVFIVTKVQLSVYMLMLPLVLLQLYLFCLGIGLLLSAINVFFRDIQYIYGALLTGWMYLTPIFYPIDQVPENIQFIIKRFNPLYFYLGQFRDVMIYSRIPGWAILLGGVASAFLALILGTLIFIKLKDDFILYI